MKYSIIKTYLDEALFAIEQANAGMAEKGLSFNTDEAIGNIEDAIDDLEGHKDLFEQ